VKRKRAEEGRREAEQAALQEAHAQAGTINKKPNDKKWRRFKAEAMRRESNAKQPHRDAKEELQREEKVVEEKEGSCWN
jgi:hypothetical protein